MAQFDPVIQAMGLVKKFDSFTAVKGIDFQVNRGECFGLLGPNGAGKTSTIRMISGFSPVSDGNLLVFGENVQTGMRQIKSRMGVVPQEDNLDPELSVLDNLLIYASYFRIQQREAQARAKEILDFMELTDKADTTVDSLSGGLKRRLTLGRALINMPELLLLDEPTTGLDPYARHVLWHRLRNLKEKGTTLMLTTHYLEEASQLCDRLVILYQGKILEQGSPRELITRHLGNFAVEVELSRVDCSPRLLELVAQTSGDLIKNQLCLGEVQLVFTDDGEALSQSLASAAAQLGLVLKYIRIRPSNLEDVFLKLTGQSLEQADGGEGLKGGGTDE